MRTVQKQATIPTTAWILGDQTRDWLGRQVARVWGCLTEVIKWEELWLNWRSPDTLQFNPIAEDLARVRVPQSANAFLRSGPIEISQKQKPAFPNRCIGRQFAAAERVGQEPWGLSGPFIAGVIESATNAARSNLWP